MIENLKEGTKCKIQSHLNTDMIDFTCTKVNGTKYIFESVDGTTQEMMASEISDMIEHSEFVLEGVEVSEETTEETTEETVVTEGEEVNEAKTIKGVFGDQEITFSDGTTSHVDYDDSFDYKGVNFDLDTGDGEDGDWEKAMRKLEKEMGKKFKGTKFVLEGKLVTEGKGDDGDGKVETEAEFRSYATKTLKDAHGKDYDADKAKKTIDGLIKKYGGDNKWGDAIGALEHGITESADEVNEADINTEWAETHNTEIPYSEYEKIRRGKSTKSSSMKGKKNKNGAILHSITFKDKSYIDVFVMEGEAEIYEAKDDRGLASARKVAKMKAKGISDDLVATVVKSEQYGTFGVQFHKKGSKVGDVHTPTKYDGDYTIIEIFESEEIPVEESAPKVIKEVVLEGESCNECGECDVCEAKKVDEAKKADEDDEKEKEADKDGEDKKVDESQDVTQSDSETVSESESEVVSESDNTELNETYDDLVETVVSEAIVSELSMETVINSNENNKPSTFVFVNEGEEVQDDDYEIEIYEAESLCVGDVLDFGNDGMYTITENRGEGNMSRFIGTLVNEGVERHNISFMHSSFEDSEYCSRFTVVESLEDDEFVIESTGNDILDYIIECINIPQFVTEEELAELEANGMVNEVKKRVEVRDGKKRIRLYTTKPNHRIKDGKEVRMDGTELRNRRRGEKRRIRSLKKTNRLRTSTDKAKSLKKRKKSLKARNRNNL